jgi:hypothetical protein
MQRNMTFRLLDEILWQTPIDSDTRVGDILDYLSYYLRVPNNTLAIWDRDLLLGPEAKLILRADARGLDTVILTVRRAAPPRTLPIDSQSVDLQEVDQTDQERILDRIIQTHVTANLQQAAAFAQHHHVGRTVRCLVVKIRGKHLRMIVDTGASVSLLYTHHTDLCCVNYLIDRREECQILLSGVGDSLNQTIGMIHFVEIFIGDVKTTGSFAVVDKPDTMGLLGIDWLTRNKATIRIVEDEIEVGGTTFKFEDP